MNPSICALARSYTPDEEKCIIGVALFGVKQLSSRTKLSAQIFHAAARSWTEVIKIMLSADLPDSDRKDILKEIPKILMVAASSESVAILKLLAWHATAQSKYMIVGAAADKNNITILRMLRDFIIEQYTPSEWDGLIINTASANSQHALALLISWTGDGWTPPTVPGTINMDTGIQSTGYGLITMIGEHGRPRKFLFRHIRSKIPIIIAEAMRSNIDEVYVLRKWVKLTAAEYVDALKFMIPVPIDKYNEFRQLYLLAPQIDLNSIFVHAAVAYDMFALKCLESWGATAYNDAFDAMENAPEIASESCAYWLLERQHATAKK